MRSHARPDHASLARVVLVILAILAIAAARAGAQGAPQPPPAERSRGAPAKDTPLWNEDQDKVVSKDPAFAIQRPNREWVFVDLERAKKREIQRLGDAEKVEKDYAALRARLLHAGHPADVYVWCLDDAREGLDSTKVGEEQLRATKGVLKDAKVTASGATMLGKLKAFAFEAEGTLADGKAVAVSKVIAWREADKRVFVVSLECPKEKAKTARKDLAKILKGITV